MSELTSRHKTKIDRLERQLNHAAPDSKEANGLRRAIKKVKERAASK